MWVVERRATLGQMDLPGNPDINLCTGTIRSYRNWSEWLRKTATSTVGTQSAITSRKQPRLRPVQVAATETPPSGHGWNNLHFFTVTIQQRLRLPIQQVLATGLCAGNYIASVTDAGVHVRKVSRSQFRLHHFYRLLLPVHRMVVQPVRAPPVLASNGSPDIPMRTKLPQRNGREQCRCFIYCARQLHGNSYG